MGFKEGFKKVTKWLNILRWVAIGGMLLFLGISLLTGETEPQKTAYIETVKSIELNNTSIAEIANEVIYTKSNYDGYFEWDIEGNTDYGKVVTVKGGDITIKIFTEEKGDYIQVDPRNVVIDYGSYQESLAQLYLNKLTSDMGW